MILTHLDRGLFNWFIFFKLFLKFYLRPFLFFLHILDILQSIFVCNAILIQYPRAIFFSLEKLFKYHKRILFDTFNLLTVINYGLFFILRFLYQHLSFIPRVMLFDNVHPCMGNAYLAVSLDFVKFVLKEDFICNIEICECPVSSLLKEGLCNYEIAVSLGLDLLLPVDYRIILKVIGSISDEIVFVNCVDSYVH